jgi:hypothetical protein
LDILEGGEHALEGRIVGTWHSAYWSQCFQILPALNQPGLGDLKSCRGANYMQQGGSFLGQAICCSGIVALSLDGDPQGMWLAVCHRGQGHKPLHPHSLNSTTYTSQCVCV